MLNRPRPFIPRHSSCYVRHCTRHRSCDFRLLSSRSGARSTEMPLASRQLARDALTACLERKFQSLPMGSAPDLAWSLTSQGSAARPSAGIDGYRAPGTASIASGFEWTGLAELLSPLCYEQTRHRAAA